MVLKTEAEIRARLNLWSKESEGWSSMQIQLDGGIISTRKQELKWVLGEDDD